MKNRAGYKWSIVTSYCSLLVALLSNIGVCVCGCVLERSEYYTAAFKLNIFELTEKLENRKTEREYGVGEELAQN